MCGFRGRIHNRNGTLGRGISFLKIFNSSGSYTVLNTNHRKWETLQDK